MQLRWLLKGMSGPCYCIGMMHVPTGKLHPLTADDVTKIKADMAKYGPPPKDFIEPVTVIDDDHPNAVPR